MSGSALNDSWGGCAADAPGRVGSGDTDTGTAWHTWYSTHTARPPFSSAVCYAADHALPVAVSCSRKKNMGLTVGIEVFVFCPGRYLGI